MATPATKTAVVSNSLFLMCMFPFFECSGPVRFQLMICLRSAERGGYKKTNKILQDEFLDAAERPTTRWVPFRAAGNLAAPRVVMKLH
jgi:hypothetical protein